VKNRRSNGCLILRKAVKGIGEVRMILLWGYRHVPNMREVRLTLFAGNITSSVGRGSGGTAP
jgi:hypothetical protein